MPEAISTTRPSRADYQAKRRAQSVDLYFRSPQELSSFRAAAEAAGYPNFNAYLLQLLANATSGAIYPPEYVDGLRRDLERARAWLEASRDENSDYRAQVKALQQQRDALLLLAQRSGAAEPAAAIVQQGARA